jgi:hypothetical protein
MMGWWGVNHGWKHECDNEWIFFLLLASPLYYYNYNYNYNYIYIYIVLSHFASSTFIKENSGRKREWRRRNNIYLVYICLLSMKNNLNSNSNGLIPHKFLSFNLKKKYFHFVLNI